MLFMNILRKFVERVSSNLPTYTTFHRNFPLWCQQRYLELGFVHLSTIPHFPFSCQGKKKEVKRISRICIYTRDVSSMSPWIISATFKDFYWKGANFFVETWKYFGDRRIIYFRVDAAKNVCCPVNPHGVLLKNKKNLYWI